MADFGAFAALTSAPASEPPAAPAAARGQGDPGGPGMRLRQPCPTDRRRKGVPLGTAHVFATSWANDRTVMMQRVGGAFPGAYETLATIKNNPKSNLKSNLKSSQRNNLKSSQKKNRKNNPKLPQKSPLQPRLSPPVVKAEKNANQQW